MTMTESCIMEYLPWPNNCVMGYQICEGGGELMGRAKSCRKMLRINVNSPLRGTRFKDGCDMVEHKTKNVV